MYKYATDLWITKYRPSNIDDIVIPDDIKKTVMGWIENKCMPHLILLGSPGCGKTSLANVLINEFNCESLELNASDERGIDVIRDKVKFFAMMASDKIKIIFMDEGDKLTPDAQDSLRNIIEKYDQNTRFIFTGNYDKFVPALKDRCDLLKFQKLDKKAIYKIVSAILIKENVKFENLALDKLITIYYPSIRSVIKNAQRYTNLVTRELQLPEMIDRGVIDDIVISAFKLFKNNDLDELRKVLIDSNFDDFSLLYEYWFDNTYDPLTQITIAEYLYRDSYVSDREINFMAMCYSVVMKAYPFFLKGSVDTIEDGYNQCRPDIVSENRKPLETSVVSVDAYQDKLVPSCDLHMYNFSNLLVKKTKDRILNIGDLCAIDSR